MPGYRGGRQAPAQIEHKNMNFLITDRPNDPNMSGFVDELLKHHVRDLVRVCDKTYDEQLLLNNGVQVNDLKYNDGQAPPEEVIDAWIDLVKDRFEKDPGSCVAVHCVAGLGRAPVLVAVALLESGMRFEDAVEAIRSKRRGAINKVQLDFLSHYKARARLKPARKRNEVKCIIL